MGRYLLVRLGWAIPIVLAIVIINFMIVHIVPGDPVQALVGDFPTPPGYIEQVRQEFGLDRPLTQQLGLYLWNLAHGNLGFSFANRQPVLALILDRARLTLLLMLPALTLAAILGVFLALAAAARAGSIYDSAITALSLVGYSMPIFWLLVILFTIKLKWLPAQGMITLRNTPTGFAAVWDVHWHLVLSALSVTIFYVAVVARVARASVLETLSQDYVLTARAKGLLKELRTQLNMAMLLISHDLGIVAFGLRSHLFDVCRAHHRMGGTTSVFEAPAHPYTIGLMHAAQSDRDRDGLFVTIGGEPPNLSGLQAGCPFAARCSRALPQCHEKMPQPIALQPQHTVRCWLYDVGQSVAAAGCNGARS